MYVPSYHKSSQCLNDTQIIPTVGFTTYFGLLVESQRTYLPTYLPTYPPDYLSIYLVNSLSVCLPLLHIYTFGQPAQYTCMQVSMSACLYPCMCAYVQT